MIFNEFIKFRIDSFNETGTWYGFESGTLVNVMINPPIRPRFINTAIDWNGNKCIIIVVGIIKIKSKDAPIRCSLLKTKKPTPPIKQIIAPSNKITEMDFGIPWLEMEFTNKGNLKILGGIATAKVVANSTLPIKSKIFWTDKFINELQSIFNKTDNHGMAMVVTHIKYKLRIIAFHFEDTLVMGKRYL